MLKSLKVANSVLFYGVLFSLLTAQISFARPIVNDNSGYLSNKPLNLSSSKANQSSRIQIVEDLDQPEKVFGLNFSFSSRGTNVEDNNVKATSSTTYIGIEFEWNVTNSIKAQFLGGYVLANGNASIVYGGETNPYTGPSFDEGSFTYIPTPAIELSAGVVNTEFNTISSTFSGSGFAGLRQVIKLDNGAFVGSIKGFQVAPSSLDKANRALDDEKNPFLTVANINVGFKTSRLASNLGYTKYDFYGMTSASARDSRYLGNSTAGEGDGVVTYQYKFRGQELALNSELTFRLDDKLGASGNVTKNDEAPEKRNAGWMAKGYYQYNFGRYTIRPSVTRFRFEPDLMPAFFSQGGLGYLNRDGYSGEIRATLKKYKLDGYIRYLDAKEIEPKPTQSDRISLTVGMEVKYEIL